MAFISYTEDFGDTNAGWSGKHVQLWIHRPRFSPGPGHEHLTCSSSFSGWLVNRYTGGKKVLSWSLCVMNHQLRFKYVSWGEEDRVTWVGGEVRLGKLCKDDNISSLFLHRPEYKFPPLWPSLSSHPSTSLLRKHQCLNLKEWFIIPWGYGYNFWPWLGSFIKLSG